MRSESTILHVDLDAFFAAVEQRDKPSLRGKPVVVGGVGGRGVVATASYEARTFGVHSAMPTAEARRRCPNAAFLTGRFHAYRDTSRAVMALLREISPLVEPLSLDEAFVDLEAADLPDRSVTSVSALGRELKERVHEVTGGLTGSVGIGTSKLVAKIASDLDKPDGLVVVAPGHGAGPAAPDAGHRHPRGRSGHRRAAAPRRRAHRRGARAADRGRAGAAARPGPRHAASTRWRAPRTTASVEPERETKSISVEDTYDTDHVDPRLLTALLERQAVKVTERLRKAHLSGRTVSIKVRLHDFSTLSRSATLSEPSDDARQISRVARTPARRAGHLRRRTPPRRRRLRASPTGSRRTSSPTTTSDEAEPDEDTEAAVAAASRHRGWAPGHGRRARGPRPRLGLGLGPRRGHGPLRDRRDRPGPGAQLRGRPTRR